ncbi:hypothetical protein [Sphingobacterium sp.]|uniref:hypothetical protein n=1 Tax=Sphingobacterium sp. TaxID=341027 RepID=UPI00289A8D91|nr:hypothetical protein [Sphingobacterium sp.]
MKLVLEKDFIKYLTNTECIDEASKDLETFLCDDFSGYKLACDIESNEEFMRLCEENPFFEFLLDKFIEIEYKQDLKIKIHDETIFKEATPRTIFMITQEYKWVSEISAKYGQLIVSTDNLKNTWEFPYNMRKGVTLKVTKSESVPDKDRFDCWEKMSYFKHNFKNIIIFDKYLLSNITPSELTNTVVPLLKNILPTAKDVNVTIVSEIKSGFKLEKYITELKRHFCKNTNFNIIRHWKALYPKNLETLHARYLLTDYIAIICDGSFTFFKKNGTVNAVVNINANLTLCKQNCIFFKKDISDLNSYLSKVTNNPNGDEKHSDMYFPHKLNPLLN